MVQPLWKIVRQFLRKVNIHGPYDPHIPLLGIYPIEIKTNVPAKTHTSKFIVNFVIAQNWKQRKGQQIMDRQIAVCSSNPYY